MKVNLQTGDMDVVGLINGRNVYHERCFKHIRLSLDQLRPSPIFRKTAREYKLECFLCGKALTE